MLAARRKEAQPRPQGLQRFTAFISQRRAIPLGVTLLLALVIAVPVFAPGNPAPPPPTETPAADAPTSTPETLAQPGPNEITSTSTYVALIQTTKGRIRAELYSQKTPKSLTSFVYLARRNFYQGVPVLKAEPGKEVESGVKNPDGTGGPGYSIPAEESGEPIRIGSLVLVADENNHIASRFRIAMSDSQPQQPGDTVIGRIIDGLDIVRQLTTSDRILGVQIQET